MIKLPQPPTSDGPEQPAGRNRVRPDENDDEASAKLRVDMAARKKNIQTHTLTAAAAIESATFVGRPMLVDLIALCSIFAEANFQCFLVHTLEAKPIHLALCVTSGSGASFRARR